MKYVIDESSLKAIANAIRVINGDPDTTYTASEMGDAVKNIMDSNTYLLVDEEGNEVPAVWVESDTVLTATANDIRDGMFAATDEGVIEGTKEIPLYYTQEGTAKIPVGSTMKINVYSDRCNYSKLQALICIFNTTIDDSVLTEKVSIDSKVYNVGSTDVVSDVVVDAADQAIDFGITNTGEEPVVIRYFTFTEE